MYDKETPLLDLTRHYVKVVTTKTVSCPADLTLWVTLRDRNLSLALHEYTPKKLAAQYGTTATP